MAAKIKAYRTRRVDELMDYAMMGDDMASYIFGVPRDKWLSYCSAGGGPSDLRMHSDLKGLDCSIDYIESLPPSLTQTQSIAKLRKLVEYFEKNVNIEGLSDVADAMQNMRDGHNNPNDLSGNGPDGENHAEAKAAVRK
jgi:hypothetical protein